MQVPYGAADVKHELKRLCDDDAIELIVADMLGGGEVSDNRCVRICGIDVQHVRVRDAAAERRGVSTVLDFEHATPHVFALVMQKLLNVITVYRCAALQSPMCAERRGSVERLKPNGTNQSRDSLANA